MSIGWFFDRQSRPKLPGPTKSEVLRAWKLTRPTNVEINDIAPEGIEVTTSQMASYVDPSVDKIEVLHRHFKCKVVCQASGIDDVIYIDYPAAIIR